jgi:L-tartrate/succinate antiporter
MGGISRREITMIALAVGALVGWIGGAQWLNPVIVAMAAISLMLLTRVVTWPDILGKKEAWSVLVWFATLIALADGLNQVGFMTWFGQHAAAVMAKVSFLPMLAGALLIFFVVHYFFASITAQTTALMPVFLLAIISAPSVPATAVALLLCYSLGLMGVISPYASGPAPIWYGSGYISTREFWRLGAITGGVYLIVLLALGIPYVLAVAR